MIRKRRWESVRNESLMETSVMQTKRRVVWCVAIGLASLLVAGCPPNNPGNDTGTGGGEDVADTGGGDAAPEDTAGSDTASPMDTGSPDTGGTDTGVDGGPADAGPDEDGDAGGGTSLADTVRQALKLRAEGFCEAAYDCPQKINRATNAAAARYGDASTCQQQIAKNLGIDSQIESLEADIDEGLTTFDADQAEKCLDELRSRVESGECRNTRLFVSTPEACQGIVKGTQANGEACANGRHCQSGKCDTSANSDKCYGECVAAAPTVGEGENCGGDEGVCDPSTDLVCAQNTGGSGRTCQKMGTVEQGDACGSPFVCKSGLNCLDQTCQKVTLRSEGESCRMPGNRCKPGLVCAQSISGSGGNETVSTSCDPPHDAGASCYRDFTCGAGLYCKGATYNPSTAEDSVVGTCTEKVADGESCERSAACQSGSCSDDGTCQARASGQCMVPTDG